MSRVESTNDFDFIESNLKSVQNILKETINSINRMTNSNALEGDAATKLSIISEKLAKQQGKIEKQSKKIARIIKKCDEKDKIEENIEFLDIEPIDIGNSVGKLPVEACYRRKNVFSASIMVTANKKFILESGSIICKGNNRACPDKWMKLREKLLGDDNAEIITCDGKAKLKTKIDIHFENEYNLREFVLGRELKPCDSSTEIMVKGITLKRYINQGK